MVICILCLSWGVTGTWWSAVFFMWRFVFFNALQIALTSVARSLTLTAAINPVGCYVMRRVSQRQAWSCSWAECMSVRRGSPMLSVCPTPSLRTKELEGKQQRLPVECVRTFLLPFFCSAVIIFLFLYVTVRPSSPAAVILRSIKRAALHGNDPKSSREHVELVAPSAYCLFRY